VTHHGYLGDHGEFTTGDWLPLVVTW
jgi:hypothetical protein